MQRSEGDASWANDARPVLRSICDLGVITPRSDWTKVQCLRPMPAVRLGMTRYLIVLALVALAGTGAARAQTPTAPPAPSAKLDPSPLLQALLKDIKLTPAQQQAVDSIRQVYLRRLPPNALTAPDSATLEQTRDLLAQALEAIRHRLDPHQKNIWDRNVANEMAARMQVGP